MSRENQYDLACQLTEDSDPNISLLACTIGHRLILSKLTPCHNDEFSRLYLFQSAIGLWLSKRSEIILQSSSYPYRCHPINGVNWPAQLDLARIKHGMIEQFIECVKADSIVTGKAFDVDYATKIIALSFDSDGELLNPIQLAEFKEVEYDYWLSGFNTPQ